ncbi:MAG: ATP-dependent helicase HrpB [Myxococcales bacterium]|nr:ATP-dependent helicase HrpB [Myxococcales bacterium]
MRPLPIDPLLPEIVRALGRDGALVIEAPPGAGKTTRVPWALLRDGSSGAVWVSEPRRIAARLAARHVAHEHGTEVGNEVGYSVRFDDVTGPRTRLVYLTDGVLLRRLCERPRLDGVAVVVLDELHERRLAGDVALALLAELRRSARPELGLVVMSATLEAEAVARFLGCSRVRSEGRAFPIEIEHLERPDDRPLERQVSAAVKTAVRELGAPPAAGAGARSGDVLVFLPGAGEIRRASEALLPFAAETGRRLLALHGELPIDEQARAVEPVGPAKIVLATNVAESSITIAGVSVVVDSGLERVATHSVWSGLGTLATGKVSRASAAQRAGRAGRTGPGRALRLYTRADLERRPAHAEPEIARLDLCEVVLLLHGPGLPRPEALAWLTPPPPRALAAATELCLALGALDDAGALTELGRRMRSLPLHPRLGRLVVEGERRGIVREACLAAALLSERDIRRRNVLGASPGHERGPSGDSDVAELAARFQEARDARFEPGRLRAFGLDPGATRAVDAACRQLLGLARRRAEGDADDPDRALGLALCLAFPDRIARRRRHGERELVLASGATARLGEASVVDRASLLVALDAEEVAGRSVVRLASACEPEWLLDLWPERLRAEDELVWNAESERVEARSRIAFGSIVLEETRGRAAPGPETGRVLWRAVQAAGVERFLAKAGLERLCGRLELAVRQGSPDLAHAAPLSPEALLERACEHATSFTELAALDLEVEALAALEPPLRSALARLAPERVTLPGGRSLEIHYAPGQAPWVASRLQDFFGLGTTPAIAGGKVPLVLHLCAPNQRAVQVTSDLAGFWQRHYPAVRRELMRRYPKHAWPEDGATAAPPAPRRAR